jgi:hypothetical protein
VAVIGDNLIREGDSVVYAIVEDGADDPGDYDFPLKFIPLSGAGEYILRSSDGVAQDMNVSGGIFKFTEGGATDQIIITAEGFPCNLVVPPAELPFISGGGESGSGEIKVQARAALKSISELNGIIHYWECGDADLSGSLDWPDQVGSNDLSTTGSNPTLNADGTLFFYASSSSSSGPSAFALTSTPISVWTHSFFIVAFRSKAGFARKQRRFYMNGTQVVLESSSADDFVAFSNNVSGHWVDGESSSGAPIEYTTLNFRDGSTAVNGQFYLILIEDSSGSAISGFFGNAGDQRRNINADIYGMGLFNATSGLSEATLEDLQGIVGHKLVRAGLVDSLEDFFGATHPFAAIAPGGTGGTSSITVSAPQPTITITAIDEDSNPIEGAAVHLDTADGVTNIIDGETDANGEISVSYTGSIPQAVAGWVRSGSGQIPYEQGDIAGTINGDFSQTVILRRD